METERYSNGQASRYSRPASFFKREIGPEDGEDAGGWNDSSSASGSSAYTSIYRRIHSGIPSILGQGQQANGRSGQRIRQIEGIFHLHDIAEGLMTKLYQLRQILDLPNSGSLQFSEAFVRSGLFPDIPKLCTYVAKRFPEHPGKMQLDKVDKPALDVLHDNAEKYLAALEPWLMVLYDLMTFREQALRVILYLSSTVVTLLPHQNPLVLHAFMDLFCAFVRVNLYAEKVPRKMLLQVYNLAHGFVKNGRDYEFYHRLVQFVDSYDEPLKGLHEDLNFVSPRVGEILEAIRPTVYLGTNFQKLRSEGFLSPFHPRYPDKLTNSAHPARAQELVNIDSYRDWVLLGYLVCPSELLRVNGIDVLMAILRTSLVLPLFRDEYILLHEEYLQYVLPKVAEAKKLAKAGRTKLKEADLEYNLAKQVERTICEAYDIAILRSDIIHKQQRMLLKQELCRMILFFSDQPSLLAPNIQMVFSALAMARAEIVWYFSHVGVVITRAKGTRVVPVDMDTTDATIGFLLDGMDKLCGLMRKYISAVRGYALGCLAAAAQRIRFLLGCPGMIALDIDAELRGLFLSVLENLERIPKLQSEKLVTTAVELSLRTSPSAIDLQGFRRDWLRIIMLVSSSHSSVTIRHLDKATISTGKESIVSEGNMAYLWSRTVDDVEKQITQHSSLRALCFYRQQINAVFKHTMFGPEGRPQHCCAWLSIASSFTENVHGSLLDELPKLSKDSIAYAESILESVMGGLEGLINILDTDGGYGSLDRKLLPEQAAFLLNQAAKNGSLPLKAVKSSIDLPGSESEPASRNSIRMFEAAVQRLTSLCSQLNELEPLRIQNHVFVPREYLRDRLLNNFRTRILNTIFVEGDLQRPSVFEGQILRHMTIIHLVEQHVSMDLTRGLREVLLTEAFAGRMRDLHPRGSNFSPGGKAVTSICDWYLENVVKDVKSAGVCFSPLDTCFKSLKLVGSESAESFTDIAELKSFICVFGPYGVDKLDACLREHLAGLLNSVDIILRANKEALEAFAANMHDRVERELALKHVTELENFMKLSLQIGHALSMRSILARATSQVLQSSTPLLFSVFADFVKFSPSSIPERQDLLKLKLVASRIGASVEQDAVMMHSILMDIGGAGDSTWALLPYFYILCMTSTIWQTSVFNVLTRGFNNSVHSLARCIDAVLFASELVRSERKELQKQLLAQQTNRREEMGAELLKKEGMADVEASTKENMKIFVQCSSAIILEAWNDAVRSPLVAKLVFLDQLCELSQHLARSTLEACVPYTVLRSIYQLYYENKVPTLAVVSLSRRFSQGHSVNPGKGWNALSDAGGENDPGSRGSVLAGPMKNHSQRRRAMESSSFQDSGEPKPSSKVRYSGPLEYATAPKKDRDGRMSPLRRFVLSRSGPLAYH